MPINSNHVTGFVVGLGAAGLGFYLYKRNQAQVDAWLTSQGIELPAARGNDYATLSLEELTTMKEQLEDLIAEREAAAAADPHRGAASPPAPAPDPEAVKATADQPAA